MSKAWQQAAVSLAQALVDQEAEIERLRSDLAYFRDAADEYEKLILRLGVEAADIARWIVEQWGYPIEVGTEKPPPEPWRRRIEDAWIERQQPMDPGNDEDIRLSVGINGGWVG